MPIETTVVKAIVPALSQDSSMLVNSINIFSLGWACRNLKGNKWKNRAKMEKMPDFPGL